LVDSKTLDIGVSEEQKRKTDNETKPAKNNHGKNERKKKKRLYIEASDY